MDWELDEIVLAKIKKILATGIFPHINPKSLFAVRGHGSTSRAIARIWSFPRVWQLVLKLPPSYVIEVIVKRFEKLSESDKDKVLIHELMHIPKTFSGALLSHRNRGVHVNSRNVEKIYNEIKCKL